MESSPKKIESLSLDNGLKKRFEEEKHKIVRISEIAIPKLAEPISTGILGLDNIFHGGFRPGELVIIGGVSGNGKSLLTLQLIKNYSNVGQKVLFFSFEEPVDRIRWRLERMGGDNENLECYVPKSLKDGTVNWIEEKVIDAICNHSIEIFIIDNLDFLTVETGFRNDDKWAMQSRIIGMLKRIANNYKVIVILNVHVKKNRDSDLPTMEDIWGSGDIFKLSDTVIFIHRIMEGNKLFKNSGESKPTNESFIYVKKNRLWGELSSFRMIYDNGELKYKEPDAPVEPAINLEDVSKMFE